MHMSSYFSPNDVERLRREAKKASKSEGITHTQALDREAVRLGYRNWALMQQSILSTPRRFPIFRRTVDEMREAFRKVKGVDGMRNADRVMREQMPDLSEQFANPMSALVYARNYLELALSLPRFNPHHFSTAWIEMRVLLPYVLLPLPGKDRFILLGRDYKPLGMAKKDEHVDYELYKSLHAQVPKEELHRITRHVNRSPGYLYDISPCMGRQYANELLDRLKSTIELVARFER
jgi:hypothetical protein